MKITEPGEITWLGDVRDVNLILSPANPLIVRATRAEGKGSIPKATVPHPEKHPYCELHLNLEGQLLEFIGTETFERPAGSLMMIGPGVPHYAFHMGYPHRSIAVHFLPIVLLQMGPLRDGARTLSRFTTSRSIGDRVFQAPRHLRSPITRLFQQMETEFRQKRYCWEFRTRLVLMEVLTHILRWEESGRKLAGFELDEPNWMQIQKALSFIHENFFRRLYVNEIARASGLSVQGLQAMFRKTHGTSCVSYLQSYRILQAKGLLAQPGARVTEAAMAVGFGTLSHFNSAFRKETGMAPTEYIRKSARADSPK